MDGMLILTDEELVDFLDSLEVENLTKALGRRYPAFAAVALRRTPEAQIAGRQAFGENISQMQVFLEGTNKDVMFGFWVIQMHMMTVMLEKRCSAAHTALPMQAREWLVKNFHKLPTDLDGFDFRKLFSEDGDGG